MEPWTVDELKTKYFGDNLLRIRKILDSNLGWFETISDSTDLKSKSKINIKIIKQMEEQ